jgi:hypothetical protein
VWILLKSIVPAQTGVFATATSFTPTDLTLMSMGPTLVFEQIRTFDQADGEAWKLRRTTIFGIVW